MPRHLPLRERFEASYIPEPNSGCWLWIGGLRGTPKEQRPTIRSGGKHEVGARVSWRLNKGPIPKGVLVLHKQRCNLGLCVNFEHLYLGTYQDNTRDMFTLGRAKGRRKFRGGW
jgi:hypothetical protein